MTEVGDLPDPDGFSVSLADLVEASRAETATAITDLGELAGAAQVVARARLHLLTTVVRRDQIRRCDVWVAREGVVALPRQASDDDPSPLLAGRPVLSTQVVSSALDLDDAADARPLPLDVPDGLVGLVEQVVAGDADTSVLNIFDWSFGDLEDRWVVLDAPDGRTGTLDASLGLDDPLALQPISALGLLQPLVARIAAACA